MLQRRTDSTVSISSGAIITALGAIGPPNIVDLPEFAPVFPTTALFGRAFRCLERLEYRAHLPGDSRTPSGGGTLRPCFRKGIPGFSRPRSGGFEDKTRVSGWTCIVRERHSTFCCVPSRDRHGILYRARSRDGATVHLHPRARVSEKFPKKSLAQSKKFA